MSDGKKRWSFLDEASEGAGAITAATWHRLVSGQELDRATGQKRASDAEDGSDDALRNRSPRLDPDPALDRSDLWDVRC